jgi:hypothetical protein
LISSVVLVARSKRNAITCNQSYVPTGETIDCGKTSREAKILGGIGESELGLAERLADSRGLLS